jgi:peptidoglycan/LPS O-acetylase OafA/YrhL
MLGLTYTQDFALGIFGLPYGALGQTWSLAVEEQFYLFWAPTLAFLLWRRWNPIPWIIGLISVSWISLWVTSKPYPAATSPLTYYRPDTRAGELFLGCLLAFVVRRWGRRIERYRSLQLVMAPIGLAALFGLLWFVNRQGRQWIFPQEEIAVGCAAAVFVLGVVIADHRKPLNFILALSPIAWLGRISYGIYIYFVAVFILVDHYQLTEGMGLYRATAVKLSILVLVAALSHYLVERPFLRIKDRISSRTMASRHAATHSEPDSLAPALKDPDVADAPVGASTARHARREEHRP